MQDLFLESFSYELQLDMHSYLHKNFILAKSGCYNALRIRRWWRGSEWMGGFRWKFGVNLRLDGDID
jgi:hypothetical protein